MKKTSKGVGARCRPKENTCLKTYFRNCFRARLPEQDDIWEISRFAVKKSNTEVAKGNFADATLDLVKSFYDFAQEHRVKSYVTVTTIACERLMRQLGLSIRRMGKAKSMQVGVERSVALRVDVDENLYAANL